MSGFLAGYDGNLEYDDLGTSDGGAQSEFDDGFQIEDVEARLELAQYYKYLLTEPFFTESTQAAQVVEKEIRQFVHERLEFLLGMGRPQPTQSLPAESPFTEAEITALKAVAAKVMKQPQVVTPKATLRPREIPKRKVGRPPLKQPQSAIAPPKKEPQKQIAIGEEFEKNGRKYKRVEAPGNTYADIDITPQAGVNQAPPMPIGPAFTAISEAQAAQAVGAMDSLHSTIASIVMK